MAREFRLFTFLFKPATRWAALRALVGRNRSPGEPEKGRFTAGDVNRLINASWLAFRDLAPAGEHQPTVGSRMNVRLAALTLALHQSLTQAGIERQYAIELVGDTCWGLYQYWGVVGGFLSRLVGYRGFQSAIRRVRPDGSWPMAFPFNPPGYRARYVATPGGLGFDVVHCPVAEYMRAHGAPDLAVQTWCMLDYPLAEMQRLKLVRTRTLAAGAAACDFRWWPAKGREE